MIVAIEKQPRTGDGHVFLVRLTDGSSERVTLLNVPTGDDERAIAAVRSEVERRLAKGKPLDGSRE